MRTTQSGLVGLKEDWMARLCSIVQHSGEHGRIGVYCIARSVKEADQRALAAAACCRIAYAKTRRSI